MALDRRVYGELEAAVGPENVSEDPCVLAGYSRHWAAALRTAEKSPGKWTPFPDAVVLPGSAEEVQKVVRICNRYGVRFKAHSTGWGPWGAVSQRNSVLLDLRRMNRILELDERNRYAVIEPYVSAMQLRAEAMKRGLTCHVAGCGPNHSVLASCTSQEGMGADGYTMSHNNRNLLAVEWVTPTGEIVRVGSPGSGAGWFCGDGPGPSLRGIFKGEWGALGGLGVFTKCSVKLYPWPGPPELKVVGEAPNYGYELPGNFRLYLAVFPDWESLNEAAYRIADAKIGYMVWRTASPQFLALVMGSQLNEEELSQLYETLEELLPAHRLEITLASPSARELEYEEKVLRAIVEETGGELRNVAEDPVLSGMKEYLFAAFSFQNYNARVFSFTGDFLTSFGAELCLERALKTVPLGKEVRRKYVERGLFVRDGAENFWGGPEEQNRFCHWEGLLSYDPAERRSLEGAREYVEESDRVALEHKLGMTIPSHLSPLLAERFSPHHQHFQEWLRRIKRKFDPGNLSDHGYYVNPGATPPPP